MFITDRKLRKESHINLKAQLKTCYILIFFLSVNNSDGKKKKQKKTTNCEDLVVYNPFVCNFCQTLLKIPNSK